MKNYTVERFCPGKTEVWEQFVQNDHTLFSTFLHSRNFLNYHKEGKFPDCSLMLYDEKNNLSALLPACEWQADQGKIFFSHRGATFGGLVIQQKKYDAENIHSMIAAVEKHLRARNFAQIVLKITPDILSKVSSDLMQYMLFYNGYSDYKELSTYFDLKQNRKELLAVFEQGKRTNVNNCVKAGLQFRVLKEDKDVETMYTILCNNLEKYETKPVHTLEELLEFKNVRLSDITEFYGVYDGNKMLAGGMCFKFTEANMLHSQYLCADAEYAKLSPMTFLYYSIIKMAGAQRYAGVSWGTSTEEQGRILNLGLIRSKEAYGSLHSLNRTFYKNI